MRLSRYPINTMKETPAEAEVVSHQLMLRAGLIRRVAAGLYSWLPFGLRVLQKVERIIREEMDRAGALELVMPVVQPAELWQESGRWSEYGPELLRIKDRHERDFVAGPTHEEVITDIARRELKSYRQLPVNFYQIQTKFRDEVRPRFGVMRAREFIMKDAYSFHLDQASLAAGYRAMFEAYTRIFTRTGLTFRAVRADSGAIGGDVSQEFQVLASSGEDAIVFSDGDDYAANLEAAAALPPATPRPAPAEPLRKVATPGARTIADVAAFLKVAPERCLKTLIVEGTEGSVVALVLRGDHELNAVKAQKLPGVASPLRLAAPERVLEVSGTRAGLRRRGRPQVPRVRRSCGAGARGFRLRREREGHAPHGRQLGARRRARSARRTCATWSPGTRVPRARARCRSHAASRSATSSSSGDKYSRPMKAVVLDESGQEVTLLMGCYGIGVTRVVAAAIEQNHDERGIIWPAPIAPFQVVLVPLNLQKSARVRELTDQLYAEFTAAGIEVLYDDRDARPGVKFADAELLGIPHRLVVAERGLEAGRLEYRGRRDSASTDFPLGEALAFIRARLAA